MAFILPRFSLQSINDIKRAIRIVSAAGVILPVIFVEDKEDNSWEIPQHPVDSNMKISDTIWATPPRLSLSGFVSVMAYPIILQMIHSALKTNQLWTVYYMGGVYERMSFVSFSKTSNAENVSGYKIEIEMQQIPVVSPLIATITAAQSKAVQDSATQLVGQTPARQKSDASILHGLKEKGYGFTDFLGGIL